MSFLKHSALDSFSDCAAHAEYLTSSAHKYLGGLNGKRLLFEDVISTE